MLGVQLPPGRPFAKDGRAQVPAAIPASTTPFGFIHQRDRQLILLMLPKFYSIMKISQGGPIVRAEYE